MRCRCAGCRCSLRDAVASRRSAGWREAAGGSALPSHDTACRNLSGGNQQKVVFAKWLARGTHILVLDDPGRGLDVGAKEDIYGLMREIVANDGLDPPGVG